MGSTVEVRKRSVRFHGKGTNLHLVTRNFLFPSQTRRLLENFPTRRRLAFIAPCWSTSKSLSPSPLEDQTVNRC